MSQEKVSAAPRQNVTTHTKIAQHVRGIAREVCARKIDTRSAKRSIEQKDHDRVKNVLTTRRGVSYAGPTMTILFTFAALPFALAFGFCLGWCADKRSSD